MPIKQLATAHQNMGCSRRKPTLCKRRFQGRCDDSNGSMAAQTAWQTARTAIIDAEIAVKLAQTGVRKAMGEL